MLTLITYPHGDHHKSPAVPYPLQDLLHISLNFRITTIPLFSASLSDSDLFLCQTRTPPPGVEHLAAAVTDAVVVDVFSPPRDDWGRRA
jgi:hypothetical protein